MTDLRKQPVWRDLRTYLRRQRERALAREAVHEVKILENIQQHMRHLLARRRKEAIREKES